MTTKKIVVASEAGLRIDSIKDISDVLSACLGRGGLLLTESELSPSFFDLHSGLAGELFQKCVTYKVRLAIVVAQPADYGKRVSELIHEHRSHPSIWFFDSKDNARAWLDGPI
ncbi:MAG TPA: DUF4180 domain-containing protein [Thermoanaerobaculia bacterium]